MKKQIREPTKFIICRNALKYTNESLKGERPPGMDRAIKQKVVREMEGHMMIWMEGILREDRLQATEVGTYICQVEFCMFCGGGARTSNSNSRKERHSQDKDLIASLRTGISYFNNRPEANQRYWEESSTQNTPLVCFQFPITC
jgi:hypothetical protein